MSDPVAQVRFVVGGVQKGGTTAMAQCLAEHPQVALPARKEAHVFDAPDFDERWSVDNINARFAGHFTKAGPGTLHGDATPIYCLHERFVQRIARYNPAMKWIVLLRHPVERAISQYHMEHARGDETWPLWAALLLERWRLSGHGDDFGPRSPLRRHSYRLRGDYARQLEVLHRYFAADQVLVLRSWDFLHHPAPVLESVYRHLGLCGPVIVPKQTVAFTGNYAPRARNSLTWRLADRLLRREQRVLRERYGITLE